MRTACAVGPGVGESTGRSRVRPSARSSSAPRRDNVHQLPVTNSRLHGDQSNLFAGYRTLTVAPGAVLGPVAAARHGAPAPRTVAGGVDERPPAVGGAADLEARPLAAGPHGE